MGLDDRILVTQYELLEAGFLGADIAKNPAVVEDIPPETGPDNALHQVAPKKGGYVSGFVAARARDGDPRIPTVQVETAARATIRRTLELTGEVVPVNSVVIATMIEGPILYCPWREGDRVQAGERLIEIECEAYRAEVQAAEAARAVAAAKLADMKAGTRPEEIVEAEQQVREWAEVTARTKADFERAERIAVQEAAMEQAAAAVEVAKTRLAECLVAAPFEGTVTAVHVRPGDIATPRAPLLELVDLSSLVVRFAVPEARATAVQADMSLTVTLDAYPGRVLDATVARVYPTLDPVMRTRTVEAVLSEPVELVPGMFARVELHLESSEHAIVISPDAILVTPRGEQIVFVVADGKAEQRSITTGIDRRREVEVVEGIREGEQVVVAGNERLRNGVSVAVPGAGSDGPGPQQERPAKADKPSDSGARKT
ncbi:MAG: efflux RND transporter periplasmic adaptor subunit [Planctomycetaceae bacterium]|nr:MAG: efflux RND transporter periplasmic adaptor subunit [Planctomycetaceae bacterium]